MPKLYLCSYFEEDLHGPGRKIGISPGKPKDVECDSKFDALSPGDLYWDYQKYKKDDPEIAGKAFNKSYRAQLEAFVEEVQAEAKASGKSVFEVLPFQDGDTLLSWEKSGHLTYRTHVAEYLRRLGYEVEEK